MVRGLRQGVFGGGPLPRTPMVGELVRPFRRSHSDKPGQVIGAESVAVRPRYELDCNNH